jgi:hypothetical protein
MEFAIPNPPWLVCKGNESRSFELFPCDEGGFEMRIVDGGGVVLTSRNFDTRELAIRWGFEERQVLLFDGWKHPYDAAVDEAFEEGVANWNLLVLDSRAEKFPWWQGMMHIPAAKRASEFYAGAPYLGLLTTDELFKRYCLLFVSTMRMTADGFLEPTDWNDLADKWIHAATEILLRDLSPDDERCRPDWSFVRTPNVTRAASSYSRRKLNWGDDVLVKYGSARFLRPALERGSFRISPANSYLDPSLNVARQDDELERRLVDAAIDMTSVLRQDVDKLSPEERVLYTRPIRSVTNYYIFCMAGGWVPRLFDDFDADACLVITNPVRFARALRDAARGQLPDWHFVCEPVKYIDPVQDLRFLSGRAQERFAPFLCKDFRYLYQKEVRAAWLPPDPEVPRKDLDHIFVDLGSLSDYCELIEIGHERTV